MKLSLKTTHSGVGGAHFGLFGRSLVLREGEGDGAGGSGATTPPGDSGTPATPPGGNGKTFTQDEVNRIAADAREAGRRSASKASPPQPAPTPSDDGDLPTLKQLQARLDESELRRTFDKRAAKLNLDDDAADDLFELYKAQKPQDAGTWFEQKASRFGLKAPTSTTPNTPTTQQQQPNAPATPAAPPAAAPAAPNRVESPVGPDGLVNIYAMSADQFAQMTPLQIRQHHEANLARAVSATGAPPAPRIPGQQQKR